MFSAHFGGERNDLLDGQLGRMLIEELGTQMAMETLERDPWNREGALHTYRGVPIPQGKPELRIEHAGRDLVMCVHIDARIHPQQNRNPLGTIPGQVVEQIELVQVIDCNQLDFRVDRLAQLLSALVVAVEGDHARIDSAPQRYIELATGNDIDAKSFLSQNCQDDR